MTGSRRSVRAIAPLLLMFIAFMIFYSLTFSFRPIKDTNLNSLQSRQLLLHGNVDLSRYGPQPGYAVARQGHQYSIYGVGISLVSAPLLIVPAHLNVSESVFQAIAAVPFVAASAVAMFVLLSRLFKRSTAVLGTLVFAFGTTAWPLASMAFWQHGPVLLFTTLGLLGLFSDKRWAALGAGFAFGLSCLVRPTTGILAVAVLLFYLTTNRRAAIKFSLGLALPALTLLVQSRWIWGSWRLGYSYAGVGFHGHLGHALWQELFGVWRGLFMYSPVLILALPGLVLAATRKGVVEKRLYFLGGAAVLSVLFYAKWTTWWAGQNQFGYRYLLDCVPVLTILAAYAVTKLPRLRSLAAAVAVLSVATMTFGALPNQYGWDFKAFPTAFAQSPIGQVWIVFIHHPAGALAKFLGIVLIGVLLAGLSRITPSTPSITESLEPAG